MDATRNPIQESVLVYKYQTMARLLFSLIRLSSLPSFIYPVQSYAFQQQTPIARSFSKFNCLSRNVGRLFFGSGSSSSIASSVEPIFSSQDKGKERIAKLTPLPSTQNIKGVIFDMVCFSFCFVLFYFVLFCFVLFCFVLFCFVLFFYPNCYYFSHNNKFKRN